MDDFSKTISEIKDLADNVAEFDSPDVAAALRKIIYLIERLNDRTAGTSHNRFIGGCKYV